MSPSSRIGPEIRTTAQLALPLIVGQLSAIGMSLVDAMLAGHYNAHVLGAVAIGASLWSLATTAAFGIMLALPPSVAQLDGANRREHIGPLFQQALWLALGLGVMLFFLLRFAAPWLVRAIGVAPGLLADVDAFVHAIAWGTPALALYFALRGLPEGLGVTRPTMLVGFTGLAALAPIGYVLMYGKFGLSPLGARGSGIATALVIWLMVVVMGGHVAFSRRYRQLGWPSRWPWPHFGSIGKLLRLGAPMGVTVLMESSLFVAVALAIGTLGEDVVAAHQVALNVAAVAFMVPLGLAMAITIRVGHAAGRNDVAGVRAAAKAGFLLVLLTQCVSSGLMLALPRAIAGLYSNDGAVVAIAAQLLLLAGVFQLSDGMQVAANGALRGLKDTRVPMFITAVAYWLVGMPVGGWLASTRGLGARGWWMGLIAGLSVAAVLLTVRFVRLSRRPQNWRDLPMPPPDPAEVN